MKATTILTDGNIKKEATEVFEKLGLDFSQAVNMFLRQVALNKGMPFDLKIPNKETISAINEDKSSMATFNSPEDILRDDPDWEKLVPYIGSLPKLIGFNATKNDEKIIKQYQFFSKFNSLNMSGKDIIVEGIKKVISENRSQLKPDFKWPQSIDPFNN